MSFQWIVNGCESLSIDSRAVVASTQTRDGVVRAVSRGAVKKKFVVTFPNGPRWSELKANIAAAQALDRYTTATISIPYAKFPWYYNNTPPASDESYTVICTSFPQWNIFARDQVSWDGPFVFVEV